MIEEGLIEDALDKLAKKHFEENIKNEADVNAASKLSEKNQLIARFERQKEYDINTFFQSQEKYDYKSIVQIYNGKYFKYSKILNGNKDLKSNKAVLINKIEEKSSESNNFNMMFFYVLFLIALLISAFLLKDSTMTTNSGNVVKDFDPAYICKAAIATLNGNKLKGETSLISKDMYSLKYTRDDGKSFTYWCKFEGFNIRWRDTTMNNWNKNLMLSYAKQGDALVITADIFGEKEKRVFSLDSSR